MQFSPIDEVVLFIGRGGSGTRLLSHLAADAGIFIGNELNKSGDSLEWVGLIYRMAVEAGGGHDLPTGSQYRQAIRARAAEILDRAPPRASRRWGLKLPETMLVLPLLIDAFPQAKVVHLTRHPISSCLRRTHKTSRLDNQVGMVALPAAYRYSKRDVGKIATDESYVHNACSWNFQLTRVAHYARDVLGSGRYLEITYEDMCRQPSRSVALVRSFLGCADAGGPTSVPVDLSRTNDWDPHDPRIKTIWELCGNTAAFLGYARDPAGSIRSWPSPQATLTPDWT